MRYIYFSLTLLCAAACSNNQDLSNANIEALPVVELRATGDIETPEPIVQAAFIPNYVAAWASHIILLSENGRIWRTTTEGDPPNLISEGNYSDILGLAREGNAGAFLALSQDGDISAYVEGDSKGVFESIAVSYGGMSLKKFCAGPSDKAIWGLGADGNAYPLSVSIKDGVVAEIALGRPFETKSAFQTCRVKDNGDLIVQLEDGQWVAKSDDEALSLPTNSVVTPVGGTGTLGLSTSSGVLFYADSTPQSRIDIVDGLSIRGIKKAKFISITPYSMGSVFSEGLIVVGDTDAQRIVIISAAFAQTQFSLDPQ